MLCSWCNSRVRLVRNCLERMQLSTNFIDENSTNHHEDVHQSEEHDITYPIDNTVDQTSDPDLGYNVENFDQNLFMSLE